MIVAAHITGSELALELGLPLYAPDAVAKHLFGYCVSALTSQQLEVLTAVLSAPDWMSQTD